MKRNIKRAALAFFLPIYCVAYLVALVVGTANEMPNPVEWADLDAYEI